ncbi:MAG: NAD-dependent protein deacylase [Chloroflexota bacterium]
MALDQQKIMQAVSYLKTAQSILFITGAGISAESGLPTYRGVGGLYNDQLTEDDIPIETAVSGLMLELRPEVTWTYLAKMEQACRNATFNPAHKIIAEMEQHFARVWVLTQNVDGFHKAAGSNNVIDIHGDHHHLSCMQCDYKNVVEDYRHLDIPPLCPDCTGLLRPDVILFGELLPQKQVNQMTVEVNRGFDLIFSIGTTSTFPYIYDPVTQAARNNVPTIEINPTETCLSDIVSVKFTTGAVDTLTAIWQKFQAP